MTEITHQKARWLLDAAAERPLTASDQAALDSHLAACQECQIYADRLTSLETSLRKTLHAKWDSFRPELDLQAIRNPSPAKLVWQSFFNQTNALGKMSIVAALLLGYFVMIHLVRDRTPIVKDETPTALPTPNSLTAAYSLAPTLSAQSTYTDPDSLACNTVVYIVQENDTLESIAVQHGITKEEIIQHNKEAADLATNSIFTGMELVIPLCETTPSYTASLPGSTLTTTPMHVTILPAQTQ